MNVFSLPTINIKDIIEILIIAFVLYEVLRWLTETKAWMLLRGIITLSIFILLAYIFQMNTILWFVRNGISLIAIALIVVFQPELRRALERIGEKNIFRNILPFDRDLDNDYEQCYDEIVDACVQMSENKTGALIVMENISKLTDIQKTGILIDSVVSKELLINIFEHNTPLHDGATIIRETRIVSATCYLPLSDNMDISKSLGTRHRAALGLSEVSDARIIVVSEETGEISVAMEGRLVRDLTAQGLKKILLSRLEIGKNTKVVKNKQRKFNKKEETNEE